MDKNNPCPDEITLLSWFDGELPDEQIAEHVAACPACRSALEGWTLENALLGSVLDALPPAGDLSEKVLRRIAAAQAESNHLLTVWYCLLIASLSFALAIARTYLPAYVSLGFKPAAIIQLTGIFTNLVLAGYEASNLLFTRIFLGKPVLPALLITAVVVLINLWQKRRSYNV